jgi:succinate dehydrogenase / fumarate reductase iron-sulfur subunit
MSFLEMLDVFNEDLSNKEDSQFHDHDCREGICGMCSLYINGAFGGPDRGGRLGACVCLTMEIRLRSSPSVQVHFSGKDLVVDRSAFDRIQRRRIYMVNTSGNVDANAIPINKRMLTLLLMQRLVLVVVLVCACRTLQQCAVVA